MTGNATTPLRATAPEAIHDATRDAYVDREGLGTGEGFRAAADAAYTATLTHLYWHLRRHADEYRATAAFRKAHERWNANRDDQRLYAKAAVHEFYVRGVEAAARDVAALLGVPEHEIERETETP
ncbi:hypothetical protein [Micromonospora carbonacea]|uniref:Uncharacterized protein n=1 Tax=Micromonospora carbonacea TaxID=47853 RepID=A0A1C5ACJ2_9ACTN|nr:hypothetical protein [Micromonospora carbonacea]SCF42879.1 hypothetical protein GA0070563_112147 [Micromonospora carbonacea]